MAMETVHSEMYSLMLDTFVKDPSKRNKLFNGINTIPAIKRKADWTIKWIEDDESPFAQRLVAFAIVEGIMFSGAFASIYWLKERNLMPGLCSSNVAISRDESLHTEFAILLYSYLQNKLSEEQIHNIVQEAVDIEIQFITESIPCNMLGMNSNLMSEYIQYVADRLVSQLGYSKIYNTKNPFPFMDRIAMENKVNFFEERPLEYNRANVGKTDVYDFSLDEDF